MKPQPQHQVRTWQFQEILLEAYDYAPGKAETCEPHLHVDYQVCSSLDFPGTYTYRGVCHPVPKGSLSILHPGEKHSSADPKDRDIHAHYAVMYLPPYVLQKVVSQDPSPDSALPFFPVPILNDASLFDAFINLHRKFGDATTLLEQETLLQSLLSNLTIRHASNGHTLPVVHPERNAVQRIKNYIDAYYARSITLDELARLVERHPVYVNMLFKQAVGIPPHAYQTQIRVNRAKRLLARGMTIGEAAQQVGFYDQSHFGRYFRRYTGVTPARYQALKTS